MQSKTPIVVRLVDGEELRGWIEWYDKDVIKLNRDHAPNLLIPKRSIKYLFKEEEERMHRKRRRPLPGAGPGVGGANAPADVPAGSTGAARAAYTRPHERQQAFPGSPPGVRRARTARASNPSSRISSSARRSPSTPRGSRHRRVRRRSPATRSRRSAACREVLQTAGNPIVHGVLGRRRLPPDGHRLQPPRRPARLEGDGAVGRRSRSSSRRRATGTSAAARRTTRGPRSRRSSARRPRWTPASR